jgi:hypothetical protein
MITYRLNGTIKRWLKKTFNIDEALIRVSTFASKIEIIYFEKTKSPIFPANPNRQRNLLYFTKDGQAYAYLDKDDKNFTFSKVNYIFFKYLGGGQIIFHGGYVPIPNDELEMEFELS